MELIRLPVRRVNDSGVGYGVSACPDGRTVFAVTGSDYGLNTLWRVDLAAGKATGRLNIITDADHETGETPVISPDGSCVVFADQFKRFGQPGRVEMVRADPPGESDPNEKHTYAFTADGRQVVGTAHSWGSGAGVLLLWNLPTGPAPAGRHTPARSFELPADRDGVYAVAADPAGREVAAAVVSFTNDTTSSCGVTSSWWLQRLDLASGEWQPAVIRLLFEPDEPVNPHVAYSPDGRTLAVGTWAGVHLFDPAAAPRAILHTRAVGLAFAPDSARLVTATARGTASVWDAVTGRRVARYDWRKIAGRLGGVAVLPDGLTAVASGTRGRLVRWDLPT